MYRHEHDHIYIDAIVNETKKNKIVSLEQRKVFSDCMTACLKRVYDGKIPPYAIIARDFSLRSRDGKSITSESIRKWMTGKALPHTQRLNDLIHWLGEEIAFSFALQPNAVRGKEQSNVSGGSQSGVPLSLHLSQTESDEYLFNLIQNLSYYDRKVMVAILRTFKKNQANPHEK